MNPRPFIKWVGGKHRLLDQLTPLMPAGHNTYHEPFLGGGAMFFSQLHGYKAILSDTNAELINCYRLIKDEVEEVINLLKKMPVGEQNFYSMRDYPDPRYLSPLSQAARMIYLNKTCFNGLYRVNKKAGKFNAPWGKKDPKGFPAAYDFDNMRACSKALQDAVLVCAPFDLALYSAKRDDFVYMDPPYMPVSKTANFTSYTPNGWTMADTTLLRSICDVLTSHGVQFMLSNANVPEVREAFDGFYIDTIQARRSVNCKGTKRGPVTELVIRNYR